MEPRAIPSSFTTTFTFDDGFMLADMRRLYESAKATGETPRATSPGGRRAGRVRGHYCSVIPSD